MKYRNQNGVNQIGNILQDALRFGMALKVGNFILSVGSVTVKCNLHHSGIRESDGPASSVSLFVCFISPFVLL